MVSVGPIARILSAQLWRESTVCDGMSKAPMLWVLCETYVFYYIIIINIFFIIIINIYYNISRNK